MLKTLDILIGVATVMLLFSMAVTIVTQFFTTLFRNRQRNLRDGLAGLLRQIDPNICKDVAKELSSTVLKHPLVAGQSKTMGKTVSREELTTLIMEIAAGQSPANVTPRVQAAALDLLKKNGVADPAGTLKCIRDVALQLEKASPELANDVRHSMAILQEAKSEYVAKIHGWFDQTIDRVSDRFTQTARVWTFAAALLVAVTVQLDTFALVNRLSVDDQFREAVGKNAQKLLEEAAPSQKATDSSGASNQTSTPPPTASPSPSPAATPAPSTPVPSAGKKNSPVKGVSQPAKQDATKDKGKADTKSGSGTAGGATGGSNSSEGGKSADAGQNKNQAAPAKSPTEVQKDYYNLLSTAGLVTLPGEHWSERWDWGKFPGILFSALLLSLGAPFWYKSLQDLLRLRSSMAQKDEQQRTTRQTTQAADGSDGGAKTTAAAAVPPSLKGEQGDLKAVG